jgi:hypothetical protein
MTLVLPQEELATREQAHMEDVRAFWSIIKQEERKKAVSAHS